MTFSASGGAEAEGATPAALEPDAGLTVSAAGGAAVLAFLALDRVVGGASSRAAAFAPEAFPPLREPADGPMVAALARTVTLRAAAFGEAAILTFDECNRATALPSAAVAPTGLLVPSADPLPRLRAVRAVARAAARALPCTMSWDV